MKKMLLAVAVTTSLFFISCNSGGGDPKTVLMAFFDAMSKKDIPAAKKLATKESDAMFSLVQTGMDMAKDKKGADSDMKFDKDKVVFGEPKIEGDKATIEVKDKDKGEGVNFLLRKEDGSWKVAFDKGWFTQMAAEKMKEHGGMNGLMDSLNNGGLDKLKEMNMDSLSDKVKEGMDKLKEIQQKDPEAAKKLEEAMKKLGQH